MKDTIYPRLRKRLDEAYSISPNNLYNSRLTGIFKIFTSPLKTFPFKIIIPISLISMVVLYGAVGFLIVRLASILQFGF